MTMDRHGEFADALEAYALGQLSGRERLDIESHLRVCASCSAEVRSITDVLEGIAETVPPVPPPPSLRQRVLTAVAELPQEPMRAPMEARHRSPWRMVPLAAAAVLVLAVGAVAIRTEQSRLELADQVTRIRRVNVELEERLKRFSGQTDLAISILTAADTREIPLGGRENAAAAAARAYWSPTRGILVVADRLPAPPPGRIYQVWIIEGNVPTSAGLLGEEPGGRGMLIATPPRRSVGGGVTVAISDEPPGGRDQPSGTIHVMGSI